MRLRARTDTSHAEVIKALRALGWDVADCHTLPNFVDCIAHRGGRVELIEIKSAKGKLRQSQATLIARGWPIRVLRTSADAARL